MGGTHPGVSCCCSSATERLELHQVGRRASRGTVVFVVEGFVRACTGP
jgi:hypothetical protein